MARIRAEPLQPALPPLYPAPRPSCLPPYLDDELPESLKCVLELWQVFGGPYVGVQERHVAPDQLLVIAAGPVVQRVGVVAAW